MPEKLGHCKIIYESVRPKTAAENENQNEKLASIFFFCHHEMKHGYTIPFTHNKNHIKVETRSVHINRKLHAKIRLNEQKGTQTITFEWNDTFFLFVIAFLFFPIFFSPFGPSKRYEHTWKIYIYEQWKFRCKHIPKTLQCIVVLIYASADFYHHIQLAFYVFIRQFFIVIYTHFILHLNYFVFIRCWKTFYTSTQTEKKTQYFCVWRFLSTNRSNNNRHKNKSNGQCIF